MLRVLSAPQRPGGQDAGGSVADGRIPHDRRVGVVQHQVRLRVVVSSLSGVTVYNGTALPMPQAPIWP